MQASLVEGISPVNRACPVTFYHGMADDVVPESFMQQGASYLATKGVSTSVQCYQGLGHGIHADSLAMFANQVLKQSA